MCYLIFFCSMTLFWGQRAWGVELPACLQHFVTPMSMRRDTLQYDMQFFSYYGDKATVLRDEFISGNSMFVCFLRFLYNRWKPIHRGTSLLLKLMSGPSSVSKAYSWVPCRLCLLRYATCDVAVHCRIADV